MNGCVVAPLLISWLLAAPPTAPQFNRDVRPILAENCLACHGPDSAARKANLRLDRRDDALAAKAIVPGKPEASPLWERINATDPEEIMPPPASHKKLKPEQKEILKAWIQAGAEYQAHWAFLPPKRPAAPAVKNGNWIRQPFDAFILADNEKLGFAPAPEADRRTLARRLSLDLVGLPPLPEEVEAFVNDTSPDYYEKYVDKLMASPHWGEHRGRYWLDAARYADTHGLHFDNFREMHTYRDWVFDAFNRNLPFDQFTIEQLAGDLLPNPTLEQRIASGFHRCNMTTNEGGSIPEEVLVFYTRDRTETTAQVWMGLTAGCAVCHDHKFDPKKQREFYELAAFFNNTTQNAMDGNIRDTPPIIPVPTAADEARFAAIEKDRKAIAAKTEARKVSGKPLFDKWLGGLKPEALIGQIPTKGLELHAPLDDGDAKGVKAAVRGNIRTLVAGGKPTWDKVGAIAPVAYKLGKQETLEIGDVGDFDAKPGFAVAGWLKYSRRNQTAAVVARMTEENDYRGWDWWFENGKVATHLVSRWPTSAIKVVTRNPLDINQWRHVAIAYDGSGKAAGTRIYVDGRPVETDVVADNLSGTIRANT
ncbi:MAG TPA: DUF1549 domain-containing protein, partial [Planctomycetia bacterium]|nr:DUF1549 domain-containing protein [Planctomycetia bacterium]